MARDESNESMKTAIIVGETILIMGLTGFALKCKTLTDRALGVMEIAIKQSDEWRLQTEVAQQQVEVSLEQTAYWRSNYSACLTERKAQ